MEGSVVTAPTGNTGPIGRPRGIGFGILLYIVTLNFYSLYWVYKTEEETAKHTGEGLGGISRATLTVPRRHPRILDS